MARTVSPPTGSIVLTGHLAPVINDLVVSCRYPNASEVMREGLRLLEQREAEERAKPEALRQATSGGLMDLEQGRFIEIGGDQLGELLTDIGERATLSLTKIR
ncbi:type II toxin-antitoxin system ParD family antitoxin [Pseudomonas batumici]|uniref:ribbon-helix-helix domain-containing protein n=1 Tax=Pseudomonas batumici TaxID=226910 RepID=UPI0030CD9142